VRDVAANDARRSDLCRGRRGALLRIEHARRRADHVDRRPDTHEALADSLDLPFVPLERALPQ
jgi:hypothetical protein